MRTRTCLQSLLIWTVLSACSAPEGSHINADARARLLYGAPAPYTPNAGLWQQLEQLNRSQRLRRQAGWDTIRKIFSPVMIGANVIPAWLTWYPSDELGRLYGTLYGLLGPNEEVTAHALDEASDKHLQNLWQIPGWDPDTFLEWQRKFNSRESLAGAAGLSRAMYNETAAFHLLKQHHQLQNCRLSAANCIIAPFPQGSVIIKASWRRLQPGDPLPIFKTEAEALAAHLARGHWVADELMESGTSRAIDGFTVALGEARYLLTGLHIMTKETKDWLWFTLWWSPAASQEFRDDSDQMVPFLNNSYRMCAVSGFADERTSLDSEGETATALNVAYRVTRPAKTSWCSNPYLEQGRGNAATNCIGCHQYAGTGKITKDILALPTYGTVQTRTSFPSDYVFGIDGPPDNIALRFHQIRKR